MYFEIHKDSSTAMHKLLLDEEVAKVEIALRVLYLCRQQLYTDL